MPMSHPRRVSQPLSPDSRSLFIIALSIYRPRQNRVQQSRFIRSYMARKETILHPRRQIDAHIHALRNHKAASCLPASDPPSPAASCVPSISARRSASLQNQPSFTTYRDSLPVLSIKTPLPSLVPPSKFSSPFTPANQVLHTPFHPPELYKGTPSKRDRNRYWQWSPVLGPQLRGVDENASPVHTPDTTDDSSICDLTRRFSLIAPPSCKHVPRRLSYSHRDPSASPFTPERRHGQALASPVLIRSSLWSPSPITSPRYQLDELHFSPFHVTSF
ncbi:hypothetical protein C8F04DRAFT_1060980 [Mycena alexandri]|uniref:Uncharacterized protein n=1 Tax=Mycena alexandri TaxID=1745969 RepID=A0AAD6TLV3_9AGAR|nr:hypothetical protein C8F04DRAFT_1060980 [Mycena alexandri]